MIHARYPLVALVAVLAGCVPIDPSMIPGGTANAQGTTTGGFGALEAGANLQETTHIRVTGYSVLTLQDTANTSERLYDQIVRDTGLSSYLTNDHYTVVLYRDKDEYIKKTNQPAWSRATTVGTTVYTYESFELAPILAHELTHAIYNGYMGTAANENKWLREGLAMYEEVQASSDGDRYMFQAKSKESLRREAIPFTRMTLVPADTEENRQNVVWYLQVQSVVAYMIKSGSTISMSNFLQDMRNRVPVDQSLATQYSGKFSSMNDLESSWKTSL